MFGTCHTYTQSCADIGVSIFLVGRYVFSAPLNFGLSSMSAAFFSFFLLSPFFPLTGGRRELAMHFTSNSEYVAMVVARDLA